MSSANQTPILSRAQAVQFLTTGIAPPNAMYFSADDQLFLFVVPSVVCTLRVVCRILLPSGEQKVSEYQVITVATRSPQLQIQNLGEGFLLSVNVYCHTNALRRGQVWLKFVFVRGGLNTQELTATVAQGYVTQYTSLFFPGGPTGYELEGRGNIRSITGTTPGAGAEISETVPTGAVWRVTSFRVTLTTSAAVATRSFGLTIDDGANVLMRLFPLGTQAASLVQNYDFIDGGPYNSAANSEQYTPLPREMYLPAGFRLRTGSFSLQAADQYAAPQYLVEEWLQP